MSGQNNQSGSTIVELVVGLFLLSMIGLGFFGLFTALVGSAITSKMKSDASTLATNQMEYLKSLSYNELAVAGGAIYSTNPLPATKTQKVNNLTYTIKTSINDIDDAFDGCTNYPNQQLKEKYCRNYPAPSGAPAVDQNPQDYKIIHVSVLSRTNATLAEVDTQISARVAETASNTGSLFVNVIDDAGNPVEGATVQVANSTTTPIINLSDSSDSGGIAIFYGLPPDTTGYDYTITSSKSGYSTLTTIKPSGVLQPNYPSQNIFAQQSSYVTLTNKPQSANSLAVETVNTNGTALGNVKIYTKGGYKKYNASSDTSYYFDNMSPSDTRITTDANGLNSISNLVPGNYYFCGDNGSTSCSINGTTYYLAAAVAYSGNNIFNPIVIPVNSASPSPIFEYNGINFLQKVRLIFTTNSNFPRVKTLTPSEISKSGGSINNFTFIITGSNLPCNSNPASCGTSVVINQNGQNYSASCTGDSNGLQLNCSVDLTSAEVGETTLSISSNGYSLNLPGDPLLGGINVTP